MLTAAGMLDGIPPRPAPLYMEIGVSDRQTLDVELLPNVPDAFLVSFEPLMEKYARGLTRSRPHKSVLDQSEPLGRHHERGLLLPFAVGPVSNDSSETADGGVGSKLRLAGGPSIFHVGRNAGCSSLLKLNASRSGPNHGWGHICKTSDGTRSVWVVPLSQALEWAGREVDFLKVDAQGMDLEVIKSGGHMLHLLQRFVLEVVADDCAPLYSGQPRCSEVVATARRLGFEPIPADPCHAGFPFRSTNHVYCELDILFARPEIPKTPGHLLAYDQRGPRGCTELYNATHGLVVRRRPPPGAVVAMLNHPHGGPAYISQDWEGRSLHPFGAAHVMCPRVCFLQEDPSHQQDVADVKIHGGRCPWA